MVYGVSSTLGQSLLAVIDGKKNSNKCVKVLKSCLLPFADWFHGNSFVF